jgi:hypothetical protein
MKFPKLLPLLAVFVLMQICSAAQSRNINGKSVVFSPEPELLLQQMSARKDTLRVLIHARSTLTPAMRQQLLVSGLLVKEYLGDSVYAALLMPKSTQKIPEVDAIAFPDPELKIDRQLLRESSDRVTVLVACDPDVSADAVSNWAHSFGGHLHTQKWEQQHLFEIDFPRAALSDAAAWYGVEWMQPPLEIKALDLDSKASLGATVASAPPAFGGYGLLGANVVIGHGDNCSGVYHVDQQDRVVNHNYGGKTNHGVLVNGLMGGQGIMDPAGMGIARKSSFVSFFFDEVILMKRAIYSSYNVSLTNNSYRADRKDLCAYTGVYDALSVNLDKLAQSNPAQLDVFAASNDGNAVCNPYPSGYYTISGGFQTAKNILAVGSVNRELILANSSSRGPLKDGRLKPEVVAPGQSIYCPIPDNAYIFESGTSLASPQAVGILALLTERYRQIRPGTPPGALLKALAINGATDMGRPGPDYWYGFGLLNARRSLAMIDSYRVIEEVIEDPTRSFNFSIPVPEGAAQLKVLLYYHDSAASPAAARQLVNDLDLRVLDPASVTHYPLVLDPAPDKVANLAKEGVDRLNNVEQVVINNPASGNYLLHVEAHELPYPGQRFYLVFDFVPKELKILSPAPMEDFKDSSDIYCYWSSTDTSSPIRIQFSPDGLSWTDMATLAGNVRVFKWTPMGIYSGDCRLRITQGTLIDESGPFIINSQPKISPATDQCPGSIAFNWTAVRGATNYVILQKKGPELVAIDTVRGTVLSYTVKGLSQDQDYYFSVQPLLSMHYGYRANALAIRADKGDCSKAAPGDLAIEGLEPSLGRRFTRSAFTKATWLKAHIRNLDIVPRNFRIRYNLNGSGWRVFDGFSIAGGATAVVPVDTVDLSAVGNYNIVMTVQNKDMLDPFKGNDTFRTTLRQLANDTIRLFTPLIEDFENFPNAVFNKEVKAFDLTERWDYSNNSDKGRFSTRAPVSVFGGSLGSVSLDASMNQPGVVNYFSGIFNLSVYDTSVDELRFDYDYVLRGIPVNTDSNRVWVRGSDNDPWIPMTAYKANAGLQRAGTLSLRDLFRRNGQNFSGSTQVLFVQSDTSVIAGDEMGTGLSIDNFRMFTVKNDVLLSNLRAPFPEECSGDAAPVKVQLRNGVPLAASGIVLGYSLDGKPPVTEVLPVGLAGDDSLEYEFRQWLPPLSNGFHDIVVWVSMPGDDYKENDTIKRHFTISNQVAAYPLLEQFEEADSLWYVSGTNPSWELGVPNSNSIPNAASGKRCWKTNLSGSYNPAEKSFLNSPCINTASMSRPMLSFSMAYEMEDCFPDRCDYLTVQYSTDQGQTWQLLGRRTEGTNWYNKYGDYWTGSFLRWHAASIDLPKSASLKLRFAFVSDRSNNIAGVAIDDIHFYDRGGVTATPGTSKMMESDQQFSDSEGWQQLHRDSFRVASFKGSSVPAMRAQVYQQDEESDSVRQQYFVSRSWNIISDTNNFNAGALRLYLEDSALDHFWNRNSCPACTRAADIYRMGITRFDGSANDGLLTNNETALSSFIRSEQIRWVPFDKGYYAEFASIPRGEFWLSDGGITNTLPLSKPYLSLEAERYGRYSALLKWYCAIDLDVDQYKLLRSFDSATFDQVSALGANGGGRYAYEDQVFLKYGDGIFYRIEGRTKSGKSFASETKRVEWERPAGVLDVYPVPSTDGIIRVRWNAAAGTTLPVKVIDVSGRVVYSETLTATAWMNVQELNLRHLRQGTYLLQLDWMEQPMHYTIQLF